MDEFYSENLVWGTNSKDNAEPVRVEKAFPAIVTKAQFSRVNKLMRSRAPKKSHPRRVGSTYLLSGLVKCKTCNRALSGQDTKSGQFAYYVCQSIMKRGNPDSFVERPVRDGPWSARVSGREAPRAVGC